jgi:ABC-type amino acid transport system permease subunit
VELVRGTPLLVQIFIFYFFIGTVMNLSREFAGVAALSLFTGAYVAEIIRSGVQSIARGQNEAARSLGLSSGQSMRHVVLPQALKRVLPPLAGQFISLVKDTSLVSVIAITELLKLKRRPGHRASSTQPRTMPGGRPECDSREGWTDHCFAITIAEPWLRLLQTGGIPCCRRCRLPGSWSS